MLYCWTLKLIVIYKMMNMISPAKRICRIANCRLAPFSCIYTFLHQQHLEIPLSTRANSVFEYGLSFNFKTLFPFVERVVKSSIVHQARYVKFARYKEHNELQSAWCRLIKSGSKCCDVLWSNVHECVHDKATLCSRIRYTRYSRSTVYRYGCLHRVPATRGHATATRTRSTYEVARSLLCHVDVLDYQITPCSLWHNSLQ